MRNLFKSGTSGASCAEPEKRAAPHARSKQSGDETEAPQAHEMARGGETDGDEETTPHKPTPAEAEK